MDHPIVSEITNQLALLRAAHFSCFAEESAHLSPNVYFCWDKQSAQVEIMAKSAPGELLSADIKVTGSPKWLTLNFGLGCGTFVKGDTIGFVIQGSVTSKTVLHPFIRSVSTAGDRNDTILSDSVHMEPKMSQYVILHTVESHEALAWAEKFHTLIVPLPKQDIFLRLMDMRVFSLPFAGSGAVPLKTLSSAAL